VEERDQLGRLEAEWADARLSYFQLQAAAAEYATRQADTARQSAEVRANSMPDPLAAELLEHRSRLDKARRALRDHTIRAPASGVAAVKVRSAGESVVRGDPVAVLYDPRRLWVGVTVEESIVAGIHEGDAVEVELADGRLVQAAVESVSPAASFATQRDVDRVRRDIRAFRLKLQLPEGSGARPGMTAYVRIQQ
jgi:multidrug resistance efflux pump